MSEAVPSREEAQAAQTRAWAAFHRHAVTCGPCEAVRCEMTDVHGIGTLTAAAKSLPHYLASCCEAGQDLLHEWDYRRRIHWDVFTGRSAAA